jgi:hypothetical protein
MPPRTTPFGKPETLQAPPPTRPNRHVIRGIEEYPADDEELGKFTIRRADYPDGFDLQWVGVDVWGQPQPSIQASYERKGWVPVFNGDFEGRYEGRFTPIADQGAIKVDGLVLMARPMAWSDKARGLAEREARQRVQIKVNQLQRGELDKVSLDPQHKSALNFNHVKGGVEQVVVPVSPKT